MLNNLLTAVPELRAFANLQLEIPFNLDSCRVGPAEWVKLAKILHRNRDAYDAFLIVHGRWRQLPCIPLRFMHAPDIRTPELEKSFEEGPSALVMSLGCTLRQPHER